MNFDGNFRRVGNANTEPVKTSVAALNDDEWTRSSPAEQRYAAHAEAQSIPLVYDDDFRHTKPTRHPALQTFGPLIRPVLAIAANFFDTSERGRALTQKHGIGYFVRAGLIRLDPGRAIDEERDENFSLTHSHRLHVPIIGNASACFKVGRETLNIPEGEIYEINNRRPHSLSNGGETALVHLVLDYVLKGEKCCCGDKYRPDQSCSPEACLDTDHGRLPCTCHTEVA